jgi:hypothetical protein
VGYLVSTTLSELVGAKLQLRGNFNRCKRLAEGHAARMLSFVGPILRMRRWLKRASGGGS